MAGVSTSQSGPKGFEMVNLDVFDNLGPLCTHLDTIGPFQTKINLFFWDTLYILIYLLSWIHPGLSQLLLSLDQFDTIRYAAYRLSTKLLTVQQVGLSMIYMPRLDILDLCQ